MDLTGVKTVIYAMVTYLWNCVDSDLETVCPTAFPFQECHHLLSLLHTCLCNRSIPGCVCVHTRSISNQCKRHCHGILFSCSTIRGHHYTVCCTGIYILYIIIRITKPTLLKLHQYRLQTDTNGVCSFTISE